MKTTGGFLSTLIEFRLLLKTRKSRHKIQWDDPILSHEVYEVLQKSPTFDIWQPDDLEAIFQTRSVDFIVENQEVEILKRHFRKSSKNLNEKYGVLFKLIKLKETTVVCRKSEHSSKK